MIALFGVFDKLVPSGEALGPPAVDRGGLSLARRILTEVDGVWFNLLSLGQPLTLVFGLAWLTCTTFNDPTKVY